MDKQPNKLSVEAGLLVLHVGRTPKKKGGGFFSDAFLVNESKYQEVVRNKGAFWFYGNGHAMDGEPTQIVPAIRMHEVAKTNEVKNGDQKYGGPYLKISNEQVQSAMQPEPAAATFTIEMLRDEVDFRPYRQPFMKAMRAAGFNSPLDFIRSFK